MLSWAITFLVIALIAGILGFGGVAGTRLAIVTTTPDRNGASRYFSQMP